MNTLTTRSYPLHVAVARGDLSYLKTLLEEETLYLINSRDDLNLTPLQVAAYSGQSDMVAFLLSKGADVSLSGGYDQNFSALSLAILQGHTDIVKLLLKDQPSSVIDALELETALLYALEKLFSALEEGKEVVQFEEALDLFLTVVYAQMGAQNLPLLDFQDSFGFSELGFLEPASAWLEALTKYAYTKEIYERILVEVNNINQTDTCYQTYLEAKFLLHVLPVDDSPYTITYESQAGTRVVSGINCHGFMNCFVMPFVSREMDAYRDSVDSSQFYTFEAFDEISKIYHQANLFAKEPAIYENALLAYELYEAGETILLSTGWEGHAVNIILDPSTDYFIVANAGERYIEFAPGAHIYQMHYPEGITPDLIFEILNNTDQMNLEFTIKYHLILDEVAYLGHPDQQYGNCSWYSHMPAIESLLYLHHLHEGLDTSSAQSLAHTHYTDWQTFEMFHCLKNYFDHSPALNIDAVLDILIDYHPSLFIGSGETIDGAEYERAAYLTQVLSTDQYRSDFYDHFYWNLPCAKPELIDLFKSADLIEDTCPFQNILEWTKADEPVYSGEPHVSPFLEAFSILASQAI